MERDLMRLEKMVKYGNTEAHKSPVCESKRRDTAKDILSTEDGLSCGFCSVMASHPMIFNTASVGSEALHTF